MKNHETLRLSVHSGHVGRGLLHRFSDHTGASVGPRYDPERFLHPHVPVPQSTGLGDLCRHLVYCFGSPHEPDVPGRPMAKPLLHPDRHRGCSFRLLPSLHYAAGVLVGPALHAFIATKELDLGQRLSPVE